VTGVSETEAREVAVALYKGSIQADVEKEPRARGGQQQEVTWQVNIRGGNRTQIEAWRVLQENGLPRHTEEGIEEVYRNTQLIPTASEERARFLLAMSGELSRSLKAIPGVVDARVHVSTPDPSVLRAPNDKPPATASVLIKYWKGQKPPDNKVKELVAHGVEGLKADDISVFATELPEPTWDPRGELEHTTPTVGFLLDYIMLALEILGVVVAIWLLPRVVSWLKAQSLQLKARLLD
jgi:type III secretion protein J